MGRGFYTNINNFGPFRFGSFFFCNPDIIAELLPQKWRPTFMDLVNNSNERDKVGELLGAIPDGKEGHVADAINYRMDRYNPKRRNVDGTKAGKPHQIMLGVLRQVSGAIDRLG